MISDWLAANNLSQLWVIPSVYALLGAICSMFAVINFLYSSSTNLLPEEKEEAREYLRRVWPPLRGASITGIIVFFLWPIPVAFIIARGPAL